MCVTYISLIIRKGLRIKIPFGLVAKKKKERKDNKKKALQIIINKNNMSCEFISLLTHRKCSGKKFIH